MENNIPFGFDDQGQPDIKKVYGTSKSCADFLLQKEMQEIIEADKRDYYASAPQTPEEANAWFIKQRRRTPEQQEAEDKRIQSIRDSLK